MTLMMPKSTIKHRVFWMSYYAYSVVQNSDIFLDHTTLHNEIRTISRKTLAP